MMRVRVSHYMLSVAVALLAIEAVAIRPVRSNGTERKTAVFALGCFWRGEAVFGCLPGVMRTRVGYAGGSKQSPDYHSIGDHAESVEVEYDPTVIQYEQLLEVFWANHDPSQVFGQGPDVGNQYRSVIFTSGGEEEAKLAMASRQREQLKVSDKVMTEILPLQAFYPAEPEHQKFELRRRPQLLQLLGDMVDEELMFSTMAAKLNGYAAGLCPSRTKTLLDTKVNPLLQHRRSSRLFVL